MTDTETLALDLDPATTATEAARREGWAAYFGGTIRSAGPFGGPKRKAWMRGWDQAAFADDGRTGYRSLAAHIEVDDGRRAWALDLYRERFPRCVAA